jgi:hypothetical protein
MAEVTTVRMRAETKALLDNLKLFPRETYDDVVKRLAEMAYDDKPLTKEELESIQESEEDIKAGRRYSLEEVMKELGDEDYIRKMKKRR